MKYFIPVVFLVCCVLSFIGGRKTVFNKTDDIPACDTVVVIKTDTVIVEKAVARKIYVNRIVKDTLFSTDTVKVEVYVPISRYIFSDSLYRAEISGYNVSLDRMEVYARTTEKIVHVPYPVKSNRRWGLGISAGYSFTPKGFQPYIGLGLQYNILVF